MRWLLGVEEADASVLAVNLSRPGRVEPRVVKRRPKQYMRMTTPSGGNMMMRVPAMATFQSGMPKEPGINSLSSITPAKRFPGELDGFLKVAPNAPVVSAKASPPKPASAQAKP